MLFVLKKWGAFAAILWSYVFSSAGFCAATPRGLPFPKPAYFAILRGQAWDPAILAHMKIAINPKGTAARQVLAAYAGAYGKAAHPEWVAAIVSQLASEGRCRDARQFFAANRTATAFWHLFFAKPYATSLYTTQVAYFGIPWEIRAGALADVGWVLAPRPGQWTTGINAYMKKLTPWWGVGISYAFMLRRSDSAYRVHGGGLFPLNDPFDFVAMGLSLGQARPPSGRVPRLAQYAQARFHAGANGCHLLVKGNEHANFSIYFMLKPVPRTLISEVRVFQRAGLPAKQAGPAANTSRGAAAKPKAEPFGSRTSQFLRHARGVRPVWFIGGRGVCYALFSGKYKGKNRFWMMKLRRVATGFRSYGFTAGIQRCVCTDGLLGTDSQVTPLTNFLAKKFAEKESARERGKPTGSGWGVGKK